MGLFDKSWEKEMMRLKKAELIELVKHNGLEVLKASTEILKLKAHLEAKQEEVQDLRLSLKAKIELK